MILNKYNEIMENITVDPALKRRIMGAVSASIRDQAEGKARVTSISSDSGKSVSPVRGRKYNLGKIAMFTSVAAVLIIVGSIVFLGVGTYLRKTTAESFVNEQSVAVSEGNSIIDQYTDGGDENTYNATAGAAEEEKYSEDTVSADTTKEQYLTVDVTTEEYDSREGQGDARLDAISKTLTFDLKGTGYGNLSDTISVEVFLGADGQKVILLQGPEGTDIVKEYDPSASAGEEKMTASGIAVRLYRSALGSVTAGSGTPGPDEINAAVFTKNGKSYMLIFTEVQSVDVILHLVDVV